MRGGVRGRVCCRRVDIANRVAIVTGGTGGLGQCITRALAGQGAHVVVVYQHSTELAESIARELTEAGTDAIAVQADATTVEGAAAMVERARQTFGRVDILVNNAGVNKWVPYPDLDALTDDVWTHIVTSNLSGPFRCIKAVAPLMREQQGGRIVNITSVAGLNPGGSSIAYAVSKAGLIHLTRCMAVALAPHVLVNSVAPGLMEGTRMTNNLDPDYAETVRQRAVLRRAADKEDVAEQVLAFVRSDSTTGQTVVIDSGVVFH
jgi:3-oxoacyl-[acyl-carrier protein] reductase